MAAELPQMNDMLRELLERRAAAHATGMAAIDRSEVEPYDAVPSQVLDPNQAWDEAQAALKWFGQDDKITAPADWPEIVAGAEPAIALPLAAGHFPQAVRDLQRLARSVPPAPWPTGPVNPLPVDGIEARVSGGTIGEKLTAVGVLRAAGQIHRAEKLLSPMEKGLPAAWKPAWTNERAALLWCSGKRAEAGKLWNSLPDSAPVLFNRGLAGLFSGDKPAARAILSKAVGMIAESSGWHHLGRLYLALAQD